MNSYGRSGYGGASDLKNTSRGGPGSNRRGIFDGPEQPGNELIAMKDAAGAQIVSEAENALFWQRKREQIHLQNRSPEADQSAFLAHEVSTKFQKRFEPTKTMMRSMDELYQQQPKESVNKFFAPSPMDEPFAGWAPDIQLLSENDLKKIEKQEERQQRYKNRGQRR